MFFKQKIVKNAINNRSALFPLIKVRMQVLLRHMFPCLLGVSNPRYTENVNTETGTIKTIGELHKYKSLNGYQNFAGQQKG